MNRYRVKEVVGRSPVLQWCWAATLTLRARLYASRGRHFDSARLLLRLEKHLEGHALAGLRRALLGRLITHCCRRNGQLGVLADNAFLREYASSADAAALRRRFASYGTDHQVRLRWPRQNDDPERQGDLIILKHHDPGSWERGVLLVKYHEAILAFAAVFDLPSLVSEYMVVLEPSNWGYQDARFLLYIGADAAVVVECARAPDFDYIRQLKCNLTPVRIGDGEWVDPAVFSPSANSEPLFDVVMVAAWDPLKRHEVLFRALARLKKEGRHLRVALIGYPMSWSRRQIEKLMRRYGVSDACSIFELIPHTEVARLVARSRLAILLSRQEGSNRSVYECLCAGTPVIVYRHHRGINLDDINDRVGLLCSDDELPHAIRYVLDHRHTYDPRSWALEHIGYTNATRRLNEVLMQVERQYGRPWTRDIVPKKSAPGVRYAEPGIFREFADEYRYLSRFLRPVV